MLVPGPLKLRSEQIGTDKSDAYVGFSGLPCSAADADAEAVSLQAVSATLATVLCTACTERQQNKGSADLN